MSLVVGSGSARAHYITGPYYRWEGDEELVEACKEVQRKVQKDLLSKGMDPDAEDRSRRIQKSMMVHFEELGFKVLEHSDPGLNVGGSRVH